ncbi:serine hydrolase domain-containing protein [Clostridium boliviensis]|uniref:Serine hydrolase domain-containing protein n=1 Tax=Clostridium boliviensis TaxID=318465 RepID=A0ABU4GSN6_9CLOT|nr:serine hydrolase domain-containing protein [Clostridium boliviensis]MDW2800010.1 serine hydrolase domain-containing protein [Clostridium boliviensis]
MHNQHPVPSKEHMEKIWLRLKESGLPIHSFLADQGGRLLTENYQTPYTESDLHRMFSITKSFCTLAVGYLLEDRLISLTDSIAGYFPEYVSGDETSPWLMDMTIQHMLTMQTCHSATTYKIDRQKNWVESFFKVPPTHKSGEVFLYDTSASHTLAALVKKLTGKGVLNYLREKCLNELDFSKDAYIIKDPFGSEMGGSGLMAYPRDLWKTGRFCMDTIRHGSGIFADYLRDAVSFKVPTVHFGQTLDEKQGYGYQIWQIRDGFAMYGMGGQYVLFYPEPDTVIVVTADTQNIRGGQQDILDIIHDEMKGFFGSDAHPLILSAPSIHNTSYRLLPGRQGFDRLSLSFDSEKGCLTLSGPGKSYKIPFSFSEPAVSILNGYDQRIAVKALWADSRTLYLPVSVVGEYVGSIHLLLTLSKGGITVWMKKIEETLFHEFSGFLTGIEESGNATP